MERLKTQNHSLISSLEIKNQPEKVKAILSSLRKDNHLSKTFEGTAKNGLLTGFYTNLALINGMVIGYVKIKGHYSRDNGDLKIEVVPSNLYWAVIAFNLITMTILIYKGLSENKLMLIGAFIFLIMALAITIAFLLESRSFINHIRRIIN